MKQTIKDLAFYFIIYLGIGLGISGAIYGISRSLYKDPPRGDWAEHYRLADERDIPRLNIEARFETATITNRIRIQWDAGAYYITMSKGCFWAVSNCSTIYIPLRVAEEGGPRYEVGRGEVENISIPKGR